MHGEYLAPLPPMRAIQETPPYARGIHNLLPLPTTHLRKHPRMHGEYNFILQILITIVETPPYARGIQACALQSVSESRNTPVCTGNTCYDIARTLGREKHPRMHGEYPAFICCGHCILETPPYARGIQYGLHANLHKFRNTPVCTGNTD